MTLSDSAQWFALHSLGHVWAGVDSAWEQEKLEATLREMLPVGAADRASERQASIAQPKPRERSASQPPVHAVLGVHSNHSFFRSDSVSTSKLYLFISIL